MFSRKTSTKAKGKVVWTNKNLTGPAASFAKNLPRYHNVYIPPKFHNEFIVGSLWFAIADLKYDINRYELPVLVLKNYYLEPAVIKINTPLLYAGTIRVEEIKNGKVISSLRHTFIAGGIRAILLDFAIVYPSSLLETQATLEQTS